MGFFLELLGFSVFLVLTLSCSQARNVAVNIIGSIHCTECIKHEFSNSQASLGVDVVIHCKSKNREAKTEGNGAIDKQGKFNVTLSSEIKEDVYCFAKLQTASASGAPCPIQSAQTASVKLIDSGQNRTLNRPSIIKFSPLTCQSAFFFCPHPKSNLTFFNSPPAPNYPGDYPLPPLVQPPLPASEPPYSPQAPPPPEIETPSPLLTTPAPAPTPTPTPFQSPTYPPSPTIENPSPPILPPLPPPKKLTPIHHPPTLPPLPPPKKLTPIHHPPTLPPIPPPNKRTPIHPPTLPPLPPPKKKTPIHPPTLPPIPPPNKRTPIHPPIPTKKPKFKTPVAPPPEHESPIEKPKPHIPFIPRAPPVPHLPPIPTVPRKYFSAPKSKPGPPRSI